MKLHSEELSQILTVVVKSKTVRLAGYVSRTGGNEKYITYIHTQKHTHTQYYLGDLGTDGTKILG
jgi:hypothetical protein